MQFKKILKWKSKGKKKLAVLLIATKKIGSFVVIPTIMLETYRNHQFKGYGIRFVRCYGQLSLDVTM